jgi:hypothetical protein
MQASISVTSTCITNAALLLCREDLSRIDNRVYRADGNPYDPDWKNTIAICAMMRQENPADVKEWLDYHRCDDLPASRTMFCSGLKACAYSQVICIHLVPHICTCIFRAFLRALRPLTSEWNCRFVGVDFVFLRENDSVSSIEQELQSYKDEGFVDHALLEGPKHPLQTNWFNDCGVMARKRGYSWVTFLDLDEFMVVLDGCAAPSHCAWTH